MNRALLAALLAGAALVVPAIVVALQGNRPSAPNGAVEIAAALRSGPAFDSATAAGDCRTLAAVAALAAAAVESDGEASEPSLRTARAVDVIRAELRALATGGLSFGDRYPELPATLAAFFAARVGESDGPLDAETRAAWVHAFLDLRDAATAAAELL